MAGTDKTGALDGITVLDCTHVIAGAWCSMMLADLGADVIKIEPLSGEVTRGSEDRSFRPYDFVNRNKRSIAIDIRTPQGADIVRRLSRSADIFVENYRPGSLERSGLGYADLSAINPRLIYCSISGFGHEGPYRNRGGFDLVAQAMGGVISVTGGPGQTEPVAAGVPLSDLNAGVFGAMGVLAALNARHQSGAGQHVEATLLESAMAYTVWETGMFLTEGTVAQPAGSRHRLAAPYEALQAKDGYIVVGVSNQGLWKRFCEALDAAYLDADRRFQDGPSRIEHRDELKSHIEAILSKRSVADWVEKLAQAGVPCGPINDVSEAVQDPQIKHRNFFVDVDGRRFARAPVTLSQTPVSIRQGAAELGDHTLEVLRVAGLSDDEIDGLENTNIIRTSRRRV